MLRFVFACVCWLVASAVAASVPPPVNPTTNAAPAIQAAIDACPDGCVVQLEPGTYRLATTVNVPSNIVLAGAGPMTRVQVEGNRYGFLIAGSHIWIGSFTLSAVTTQTSGGGISFASAGFNVAVANLVFEHGLYIGVDVAPTVANRGIYTLRSLRWNGVASSNTAVKIGNGTHHLSDVSVTDLSGTASTPADMAVWVDVLPQTDTIDLGRLTLIKGGAGVRVGVGAVTPSAVTGFTLHDSPAIESMTAYGVLIQSANNVRIENISAAQNQGGVGIGAGVRGLLLTGSVLHYNKGDGVTMWAGASGATISNNLIADNNTLGSYWGFGVSIGSGVSDFTVSGNRIGNALLWGGGFQRYCVFLASGASNRYSITGNACVGHTYGDIVDGGTGTKKVVSGNY